MLSTGSVSIQSSSKKKSKISITSQFSPAVTRSKSTARMKRLMRMTGKTPGKETESRRMYNSKNEIDTGINTECLGIGWKASSITALTWARVAPKHRDWIYTEQEKQEDESWKYRSYFLDRSSFFLPPNTCNSRNVIPLITPINTALTAKHPSIYCVLQHALMDYTSTYMDNIAYSVFPHRFLCLTLTHQ